MKMNHFFPALFASLLLCTAAPAAVFAQDTTLDIALVTDGRNDSPATVKAGDITMKTERKFYDSTIDSIRFFITNHTKYEYGYGTPFKLERYQNGKWQEAPLDSNSGEKAFPSIGIVLPPEHTNTEMTGLSLYRSPLPSGRYRVTKNDLGPTPVYAEFTVLDAKKGLNLSQPATIKITDNGAAKGTVTITGAERYQYQDALTTIWHELLVLQPCAAPQPVPKAADLTLRLTGKDKKVTTIRLYAGESAVYAKQNNTWYQVEETGMIERLRGCVKELGGYLPDSAENLIASLQKTDALKDVTFSAHQFTIPFAYDGWQSDHQDTKPVLSIFRFPSASALNTQMQYLYDGGYGIGKETQEKNAISFHVETYNWALPPHYYKAREFLILYNGSDPAVLAALESVLGSELPSIDRSAP